MSSKTPLTVYYMDDGSFNIYELTAEQINKTLEKDGYEWDTVDRFQVPVGQLEAGYAPAEMIKLGELLGFDVESI